MAARMEAEGAARVAGEPEGFEGLAWPAFLRALQARDLYLSF